MLQPTIAATLQLQHRSVCERLQIEEFLVESLSTSAKVIVKLDSKDVCRGLGEVPSVFLN